MGAKQSKPKNDDDNELKLPNVLDHIATNYITKSTFVDLENLHDPEYCNKLVILTSKIIESHLHLIDIDYVEQRTENGDEINKMGKDKVLYLGKENLEKIDVQNSIKKRRMCVGIARFYVRIAHIFAAVSKTVNPSYSYIDAANIKHEVSMKEKANLPKHINVNMAKYNLCSRRIAALQLRQNTENGMIVKVKNCEMNKKNYTGGDPTANIQPQHIFGNMQEQTNPQPPIQNTISGKNEENINLENSFGSNEKTMNIDSSADIPQNNINIFDNSFGKPLENEVINPFDVQNQQQHQLPNFGNQQLESIVDNVENNIMGKSNEEIYDENATKNLTDEPGIPELEMLYYDVYDFNEKAFNKMSKGAQKDYNDDLKTFYETFTGKKIKKNSDIKKFSDIQLVDFHNQSLCKDDESPWVQSYKNNGKHKLFKKYAKHMAKMISKTQENEKKLLSILEDIFVYWIEPEKNIKKLTINPKLTHKSLDVITKKARDLILNLYVDCEKDFQTGLNIFETIVKKSMFETKIRQNEQLNEEKNKIEEKNNI